MIKEKELNNVQTLIFQILMIALNHQLPQQMIRQLNFFRAHFSWKQRREQTDNIFVPVCNTKSYTKYSWSTWKH